MHTLHDGDVPPAPPSIGFGPSGSITLGDNPTALPPPPPATTRSAPEPATRAASPPPPSELQEPPIRFGTWTTRRWPGSTVSFRVDVCALAAPRRKLEGLAAGSLSAVGVDSDCRDADGDRPAVVLWA